MRNNYELFKKFVFRIPLLPITSLDIAFLKTDIFKEALYLASRDLLEAFQTEGDKEFDFYPEKLQLSLIKYLVRMSSRCTPFGLFAGCGVGDFSESSTSDKIVVEGLKSFRTVTRLDMDFVAIISKAIMADKEIKRKLLYYPNNTLYQVGDQYRFIDFKYINKKRSYQLTEIDTDEYIHKILNFSKKGIQIDTLIEKLNSDSDYTEEDINNFILDLIDNQVLVSELYPRVTGDEAIVNLLKQLIKKDLKDLSSEIVSFLSNILKLLSEIDHHEIGRPIDSYLRIEEQIKQRGLSYNPKYLFQSDLFIEKKSINLDTQLTDSIYDACVVLNKLTPYKSPPILKDFKEALYKRYEHEEVLLTDVLDTDIGLGFARLTPETTGQNILLENLSLGLKRSNSELTMDAVDYMLLKKYHNFLKNGLEVIDLIDDDLTQFPENYNDLPATMVSMVELLGTSHLDNKPLIYVSSLGGPSATNILARFSQGNDDILKLVNEIIQEEEKIKAENEVLAEIVHLPESRTGNILYRPVLRSNEIPYLALSGVDDEHTIPITDLMLSLSLDGKLKLRSKALNKYILPKLSSAHNFSHNSLPIYHFLCMLQFDGTRNSLGFNWGSILEREEFLPRVTYKNIILSPARWKIEEKEIVHLFNLDNSTFNVGILDFKLKRKLPDKCLICLLDNKMFIDFEVPILCKLFVSEIKKYKRLNIEEFLYDLDDMVIKDRGGQGYTNQIVFCYHKIK